MFGVNMTVAHQPKSECLENAVLIESAHQCCCPIFMKSAAWEACTNLHAIID